MASFNNTRAVYRTDGGKLCPQCQRPVTGCVCGEHRPASVGDGIVRIRLEKKGRGGKWVTVIEGIPEHPDRLKVLSKQLKQQCGVGGGVKGLNLEIQGDQRLPCQQKLQALGYIVKLVGG